MLESHKSSDVSFSESHRVYEIFMAGLQFQVAGSGKFTDTSIMSHDENSDVVGQIGTVTDAPSGSFIHLRKPPLE